MCFSATHMTLSGGKKLGVFEHFEDRKKNKNIKRTHFQQVDKFNLIAIDNCTIESQWYWDENR